MVSKGIAGVWTKAQLFQPSVTSDKRERPDCLSDHASRGLSPRNPRV